MLLNKPESEIIFNNKKYRLNLAYDNILRVFKLQKDSLFSEVEKIALAAKMLTFNKSRKLSISDQSQLLVNIFNNFVAGKSNKGTSTQKLFDFEQDAPYIYAAFMQSYHINLIKQQGKLDWREFIALFQGLPESTKIREIMEIRGRKMPKPDKYNAEEIKALHEAKAFFALEYTEKEAEESFQQGLDRLAAT